MNHSAQPSENSRLIPASQPRKPAIKSSIAVLLSQKHGEDVVELAASFSAFHAEKNLAHAVNSCYFVRRKCGE